jgi:hypothetical protein
VLRWSLAGGDVDDVVFAGDRVVTLQPGWGEVRINDMLTGDYVGGDTLDPQSTGNDRFARLVGIGTAADEAQLGQSGPPATFADPRVVQVSLQGKMWLENSRPAIVLGAAPPKEMVAFDGWLVTHDAGDPPDGPQHIRAFDVTAKNGSRELGTLPGSFVTFGACGFERVCVATRRGHRPTEITAFDVPTGRQVWHATSKVDGDLITSSGGRTVLATADGRLDLFDSDGQRTFTSQLPGGGWLDASTLLVTDPDGSGRLARLSIADRTLTPLGAAPSATLACASTSDRLVCATATTLTTWNMN